MNNNSTRKGIIQTHGIVKHFLQFAEMPDVTEFNRKISAKGQSSKSLFFKKISNIPI